MAFRLTETADSQSFRLNSTDASAPRKYVVQGAAAMTAGQIHLAILADTTKVPYRWEQLIRTSLDVQPLGGGVYTAEVLYALPAGGTEMPGKGGFGGGSPPPGSPPAPPPPQTPGEEDPLNLSASFAVKGEKVRIFQSVKTLFKKELGTETPRDFKGAINVTAKGVQGVELPHQPCIDFDLNFDLPFITRGYVKRLSDLVNKVNKLSWWGYPPHTVCFLGANGQYQKSGRWSIGYKFGLSPTRTDVEVAEDLVVPEKRGWDYIWCYYAPEVSNDRLVQTPQAVYCEQVHEELNFGEYLGFGE